MTEVRLYHPGDEIAINDAFNRVFGKQRSVEEWAWKYRADEPPCPIVAAWDSERLAAHNGGIAADYQVDGRRIVALQGADTFSLAVAERQPGWRESWQRVMDHFGEIAADQFGASLLYGFTGGRAISHMVARAGWDSVSPRRIPLLVRRRRPPTRSMASRLFRARLIDGHEPAPVEEGSGPLPGVGDPRRETRAPPPQRPPCRTLSPLADHATMVFDPSSFCRVPNRWWHLPLGRVGVGRTPRCSRTDRSPVAAVDRADWRRS